MLCFVWFIAICIFTRHTVSPCLCGINLPSISGAEVSVETPSTPGTYSILHLFPRQSCSNKLKDIFPVFWTRFPCYLGPIIGDHPMEYSRETVELISKSLFVVLCILAADLIDSYYSDARPKDSTSTKLPILSKILYVVGWLTCAIISPISYWPEMEPLYQGKDYKEELDTKTKLIDEAQQEAVRMERHTIFLQESCILLQEQLKSQQLVNKSVLQKYTQIHKLVQSYLGTDLQQLHLPETNSSLASSPVKSTTKKWAWLFTNNDINSQQAIEL